MAGLVNMALCQGIANAHVHGATSLALNGTEEMIMRTLRKINTLFLFGDTLALAPLRGRPWAKW